MTLEKLSFEIKFVEILFSDIKQFCSTKKKTNPRKSYIMYFETFKKAIMKRFYFENLYFKKRIEKKTIDSTKKREKNIFLDAAEELNNFFTNVVSNLDISKKSY